MSDVVVHDLFGALHAEEPKNFSANVIGTVAEFLACAALAEMGYVVHHVPSAGYDVICDADGTLIRVQVKGVSRSEGRLYRTSCSIEHGSKAIGGNLRKRIRVPLTSKHCDVIALVAIDRRRVLFLSVDDVSVSGTLACAVSDFAHPDAERISWLRAIE